MAVPDRISFAPLAALARAMSTRDAVPDIPALLATLEAADRELAEQTHQLRTALATAERRATTAETAHTNLLYELEQTAKEIAALKELVTAREAAHRAQDALVQQLKNDNATLRQSYAAAVRRAGDAKSLHKFAQQGGVTSERRISVTVAGNKRDMAFSDAELAHMFTENERLEAVGQELVRQVETQKNAHAKLRDTVGELMTQLVHGARDREARDRRVKTLERSVKRLENACGEKEERAAELQRKLNKLQAEYDAVSVAHSYSNAELVKLKMKVGAKKNERERTRTGGVGGAVLGGVENLLHRRNK